MQKPVIISLFFLAALITGCSKPPSHQAPIPRPPGYRCIVVNHKEHSCREMSWSTNKRVAISRAMKHCRKRSRYPGACRLKTCIHTGLPSKKYWYTCYVTNRNVTGLWCSTSHSQFTSTSRAFDRCRRLSGKPAACYFKYCRVW